MAKTWKFKWKKIDKHLEWEGERIKAIGPIM